MNAESMPALWRQNPMLARLLGLSPLLAASHSLATALGLGLATLSVTLASTLFLMPLRHRLSAAQRVPAALLVIATTTSVMDLCLQAFLAPLREALGLYVPLIAVNGGVLLSCGVLLSRGVLEFRQISREPLAILRDGAAGGLGMLLALTLLGSVRELLAQGTLLGNFDLLLGSGASGWTLHLAPIGYAFPFWTLPAGGFIAAGFLLALHRVLIARQPENTTIIPAARARVTASVAASDDAGRFDFGPPLR